MTLAPPLLVCSGCGAALPIDAPEAYRCPAARAGDDTDHVLAFRLPASPAGSGLGDPSETNPFVRWRTALGSWHRATASGWSDARFVDLVRRLDEQVAKVDGRGFRVTPFGAAPTLSEALGFAAPGGVLVKDETGNVSGSHKARHLFGILLHLEVAGIAKERRLAIASCGNAALAAAVVAKSAGRPLDVFIPPDASEPVVRRLEALEARLVRCPRVPGESGDPCVLRFRDAVAGGALPFTCQGPDNGLAIEGGEAIAREIVSSGERIDRIVLQVGGGALASAVARGLLGAVEAGALPSLPRISVVQTRGAFPLPRALDRLVRWIDGGKPLLDAAPSAGRLPEVTEIPAGLANDRIEAALRFAATHRSSFMWPWESEPKSLAHGILDDETYDWLSIARGLLRAGGEAIAVDEETIARANDLGRSSTGIAVDPTGTSGLAGLLALRRAGIGSAGERVAVLFTGAERERGREA
jgi:threonine synthase